MEVIILVSSFYKIDGLAINKDFRLITMLLIFLSSQDRSLIDPLKYALTGKNLIIWV